MKYFGGCDAGSTYTKCVIIDENGKIAAAVTKRSRINPVLSAKDALDEAVSQVDGLNSAEELTYLIGTGYGRNKVPFADENISEINDIIKIVLSGKKLEGNQYTNGNFNKEI